MSWSISLEKQVPKADFEQAIDALKAPDYCEPAAVDQVQTAKQAAKLMARSIPGPYIMASLSGHANGVGWQMRYGYADDSIYVSVSQVNSPPAS